MKKINDKLKLKIAAQAAEIEKLKEAHSSCAINLQKLQKSKAKIDNKYQILGQNWEILVNNCENECLRREMKGIKRVCDDHQIDPKQYAFIDIPADKDFLDDPEGDEDILMTSERNLMMMMTMMMMTKRSLKMMSKHRLKILKALAKMMLKEKKLRMKMMKKLILKKMMKTLI